MEKKRKKNGSSMLINAIAIHVSIGNGINAKCINITKDFFLSGFEVMFQTVIQHNIFLSFCSLLFLVLSISLLFREEKSSVERRKENNSFPFPSERIKTFM